MKKSTTVFISLAVLALGGAAWALDTNSLTVRTRVAGMCKFSNATRYWCTNDVTMSLAPDATPNAGLGSPRTLTIAGSIPGADSIGVTEGTSRDSVTLTIYP